MRDALAYLPANPVFSGLRALSSRGFHAPVKQYMRLALQGMSEAGNNASTKQWRSQLSSPAKPIFSGFNRLMLRDFKKLTTMTTQLRCRLTCASRLSVAAEAKVHVARQGVCEAGNDESTRQWRSQLSPSAKSIFSGFSAMLSQGNNERTTMAVHVARQGVSEAGNDESTKQWRRK